MLPSECSEFHGSLSHFEVEFPDSLSQALFIQKLAANPRWSKYIADVRKVTVIVSRTAADAQDTIDALFSPAPQH